MPRSERAPSFQFYPGDYLLDEAVAAMSYDEQGRYWTAICRTWQTDTPGEAIEAQWRFWCGYSERQWAAHRDAIARAFDVRGDVWIQRRTVETREAQLRRQQQARSGAEITNERRKSSHAQRTHSVGNAQRTDSARTGVAPSSSSSQSSSYKEKERGRSLPAAASVDARLPTETVQKLIDGVFAGGERAVNESSVAEGGLKSQGKGATR